MRGTNRQKNSLENGVGIKVHTNHIWGGVIEVKVAGVNTHNEGHGGTQHIRQSQRTKRDVRTVPTQRKRHLKKGSERARCWKTKKQKELNINNPKQNFKHQFLKYYSWTHMQKAHRTITGMHVLTANTPTTEELLEYKWFFSNCAFYFRVERESGKGEERKGCWPTPGPRWPMWARLASVSAAVACAQWGRPAKVYKRFPPPDSAAASQSSHHCRHTIHTGTLNPQKHYLAELDSVTERIIT